MAAGFGQDLATAAHDHRVIGQVLAADDGFIGETVVARQRQLVAFLEQRQAGVVMMRFWDPADRQGEIDAAFVEAVEQLLFGAVEQVEAQAGMLGGEG